MRKPRAILLKGAFLLLLAQPRAIDPAWADAAADGWQMVGTEDGITVYRKQVQGDPVFAYRGEGILDAPIGKLISVSRDTPRHVEWVNRLKVSRVIREITPFHRIVYFRVGTPWPVQDRDFVLDTRLTVDRARRSAVFEVRSAEDPQMPPDPCCVRGVMHFNRVELKEASPGKTAINAEAHVDPRGRLPAWIVNLIQRTFPRKSIAGLLRQVAKPDIPDFFAQPDPARSGQPTAASTAP